MEDDPRVNLARVRMQIRKIEAERAKIRRETHFYQQLGFGRDIKDIQLLALEDEKAKRQAELRELLTKLRLHPNRHNGLRSLVLLPLLFITGIWGGSAARSPKSRRTVRGCAVPFRLYGLPKANADLG